MYQKKIKEDIRCPLEYGLSVFGGKWKSRIICVLAGKKKLRYSEIRKEMCNITDAVLASTLKELIKDGIVNRKSYDEIPPRVEYSLTKKGNLLSLFYKIYVAGRMHFIAKKMNIHSHNVRNVIIDRKNSSMLEVLESQNNYYSCMIYK